MKWYLRLPLLNMYFIFLYSPLSAQDPVVPSANLGLSNLHAGKSRPPGLYYTQYLQSYKSAIRIDAGGQREHSGVIASILALQQITCISKSEFLGGYPGITLLATLTKSSNEDLSGAKINPNVFGDLMAGPFLQWYDKTLFNLPFSHRIGVLAGFPTGAYSEQYAVNPGSHYFRIYPNYQFSISPADIFAISIKNNVYFYFNEIGKDSRPGVVYNLNYALEFTIKGPLILEAAGYYLGQLAEDAYKGNHSYFQNEYGLKTTKERVFAFGPGLGYITDTGFSIEAKVMWETEARNRAQGFRSTLVMTYRL